MMYYRHAGINYKENSARIRVTRASFASLPGELRNLTYAATLKWASPITVVYDADTESFTTPNIYHVQGRTPIEALRVLSNLDHNIRCEARSYFFANNIFMIETKQTLMNDPDYVRTYIAFLEEIGSIGRRSLRWLRLTVSGDSRYDCPTPGKAIKLWTLLGECGNLLNLDIAAEIDYFYIDQQAMLKMFMSTEGYPLDKPWAGVLDSIHRLKNLQRLTFRPVFSGRWRRFAIGVNGEMTEHPYCYTARDVSRTVLFRIDRPIAEAVQLSDQLKGHVRKGLRGSVRAQVVRTESWDEYGRDILMEHEAGSGVLKFRSAEIIKPFGRTFDYTNGFDEG
ncbi:hypothetical protein CC86DRAFT_185022 [Ophiobolus disseminans]|uniref:Uncharacterized protein n=1 Tax=Ophiobolus disseminans TaxID=1469910 RepID=A0A6A7A7J3_9PLEO|nr:hypothetical protein CC86DRAFT_185022 [Ophiobolus disseminans]